MEDEAVTRTALTVLLEYQGATVLAVGSIQEGVDAIESGFQPDLVVSNIRLPDGNGAKVLGTLRRYDEQRGTRTPAIALTGEVLETVRQDPESAGFDAYLSKPFNSEILLGTIAQALEQ